MKRTISAVQTLPLLLLMSGCDSMDAPGGTVTGVVSSGSVSLSWYLDLPEGEGPFPTVIYGGGSGNVSGSHDSTIRYARLMNDIGYAVVRYDKRGTGKSTGDIPNVSTANSLTTIRLLADDMMAVFDDVTRNENVDSRRVGLMGASQANWYVPVVAQDRPSVGFMIIVTGGVLPVGFKNRFEELTRVQGHSNSEAAAILGLLEDYSEDIGFSQLPILERLNIPSLYLLGDDDLGFPMEANLVEMERLKQDGADLSYIVYPGGKHLLGNVDVQDDIEDWLSTM